LSGFLIDNNQYFEDSGHSLLKVPNFL
jgi:hypothetical protein